MTEYHNKMQQIKNFFTIFSPLINGIITTSVSLAILGPYMASKHQIYSDIILEMTALSGTNKSGEIFNFWLSMLLGILTIIISVYLKKEKLRNILNQKINDSETFNFPEIRIIFIPIILFFFITQKILNFYLFIGILYLFFYNFIPKKIKKYKLLLLMFCIYFFVIVLKVILGILIPQYEIISQKNIYLIIIAFFSLFFYFLKRKKFKDLNKIILLLQIPIPVILLIYLSNKYLINNTEIYKLSYPKQYIVLILLLTIVLTIMNFFHYQNYIKQNKKSSLVMLSTIIIIFIIHHHVTPMYYHSGDFWHWGEEVMPWQELINKHLSLYSDYSGTSGLYGLVLGFFQNLIFHGVSFSYLPSLVVTNIFWVSLYGILCYLLLGGNFSFVIALLTFLPEYNRINVFIILVLLLSNHNLIIKRIQWLQLYILISIISVFYYPLNGVAGILGALPFSIIQIYLIYKEKLYLKILKNKLFWILNILLIYTIILVIKYGIKLIKMIILLSSQTKLADGITAYGQSIPPSWFMVFISNPNLRNTFWYIFIFLIMISIILTFLYFFFLYMLKKGKILNKFKKPEFFILTFFLIAVPINYTFTTIRIDSVGLFGRTTATMMVAITFGLLVFLYKYGHKILNKNIKIILLSFCITLVLLLQDRPPTGPDIRNLVTPLTLGEEIKNIKKIYELNDVIYIDGKKEGINKLGKGFISKEKFEYLKTYKEVKEKLVKSNEYIWPLWDRELVSIFNSNIPVKIDSPYLTKSLQSSKENLASMKEKPILITNLLNYQSYYTYRWIIDNGYIMYQHNNIDFWIRPDRYQEIFGNIEEAKNNMLNIFPSQEIAKIPYSLGNSINSLNKIFNKEKNLNLDKMNIEYNQINKIDKNTFQVNNNLNSFFTINLSENINGKEFDFIYLELSSNKSNNELKDKKIQLSWSTNKYPFNENRSIKFDYGNGKFLIPVGIHPAWLNLSINKIRFDFKNFENKIDFKIKKIKFLKLNLDRNY